MTQIFHERPNKIFDLLSLTLCKPSFIQQRKENSVPVMANRNIVDVLTEYEDGQLIYSCTFDGKHKLAKYVGMKLWLKENGAPDGMIQMLEGLFWLLELSEVEKAFRLNDPVIISLMKSHVSQKKGFFQVLSLIFLFFRGGSKVLEVICKQNEVQIKTSTQEEI